ncbi:uncharacterized protein LOC116192020 isoform X1 [Punica granatum]|nr:uncharacterized protein LOC116192020 isoform X1 [Punica granatum]
MFLSLWVSSSSLRVPDIDLNLFCLPIEGHGRNVLAHIFAASFMGFVAAAAARNYRQRRKSKPKVLSPPRNPNVIPHLDRTESGHLGRIESFSHYVARQLGFEDESECPQLCKLAMDYLKRTKGCEDSIYEYFANEPDAETLYVKLLDEFESYILGYFAFHWNQASEMINQVLSTESEQKTKLKSFVLAATRKQRFERVTKNLKVTRVFSTLVEEMKAIGSFNKLEGSECTEVMAPVAHNKRSPVLLLMGGGMGAGKSTVLKDILKQPFWAEAAANAVVVEADAFKETDVIYKALNSRGRHDDMLSTAELVHQNSTSAASSLLVTALNEGRDVILDGTLSWEPYVEQTIAMARDVHRCRYRMGVGYKVAEDGTVTENYWEQFLSEEEGEGNQENGTRADRKPYRIEMVGVVCDAYLAVVRGIRRAVIVGRAVRVNSQLTSHKRFANAFRKYCHLVDNARLYCTNAVGGPPTLIAWKEGENKLLVDPEEIKCLNTVGCLNPAAESIYELYQDPSPIFEPGSIWKDIHLAPTRPARQVELKSTIKKIEEHNKTNDK